MGGSEILELSAQKIKPSQSNNLYSVDKPEKEPLTVKAVPYCYWGNRKTGEMSVWIKEI